MLDCSHAVRASDTSVPAHAAMLYGCCCTGACRCSAPHGSRGFTRMQTRSQPARTRRSLEEACPDAKLDCHQPLARCPAPSHPKTREPATTSRAATHCLPFHHQEHCGYPRTVTNTPSGQCGVTIDPMKQASWARNVVGSQKNICRRFLLSSTSNPPPAE